MQTHIFRKKPQLVHPGPYGVLLVSKILQKIVPAKIIMRSVPKRMWSVPKRMRSVQKRMKLVSRH